MKGETTYYRRIQVILELSGARKPRLAEEFIQGIVRRSPPNFVYHRWDAKRQEIVPQCSEPAVRRAFNLAAQLGLVDAESAGLTTQGSEAADPNRFGTVLRRRVRSYLQQAGCSVAKLEDASLQMLQARPIQLPTAEELYVALYASGAVNPSMSEFSTLLRLLAASDGIKIVRRHLFLPSNA